MNRNLPLVIIGCDAPQEVISRLEKLGFALCVLERDARLPKATASHADMLILSICNTLFCSRDYLNNNATVFSLMKSYGYDIVPVDDKITNTYPHDIPLNLALVGKYLFGKLDSASKQVLDFSEQKGIQNVFIKQGYAKCSMVVLGTSAIITADSSIEITAKNAGIDVLKIENSPSAVKLVGYKYGFIGGACGVYENTVYFTGDIRMHPNYIDIMSFCKKHGFDVVSLCDGQLTDVGGIIFLPSLS